jgi:hypothetical protein
MPSASASGGFSTYAVRSRTAITASTLGGTTVRKRELPKKAKQNIVRKERKMFTKRQVAKGGKR